MASLEYRPLNKEENEFRILAILPDEDESSILRCTLNTYSLTDPPQFYALSYVWGDPTVTTNIIVNDAVFPATINLEQAPRALRSRLCNGFDNIPMAAGSETLAVPTNPTVTEATSESPIQLQLPDSGQFRLWVDAV